jgi:adenylate cyclase
LSAPSDLLAGGVRVILCADIVGSTELYERDGNASARRFSRTVLGAMAAVVIEHRGRVVEGQGDELLCLFDEPRDAALAAGAMHERVSQHFMIPGTGRPQRLHVGMNLGLMPPGPVDLLSELVRVAHWACANAKPDQTLVTQTVLERLPPMFKAVSRHIDDETWDASSASRRALYEIVWDVEAATVAGIAGALPETDRYTRIWLSQDYQSVSVSAERPVISVGRNAENDLVITHELASRLHFTVQLSRGRGTLRDLSTNGTLVTAGENPPVLIRHDTFVLEGEGTIGIGHAGSQSPELSLHWRCE